MAFWQDWCQRRGRITEHSKDLSIEIFPQSPCHCKIKTMFLPCVYHFVHFQKSKCMKKYLHRWSILLSAGLRYSHPILPFTFSCSYLPHASHLQINQSLTIHRRWCSLTSFNGVPTSVVKLNLVFPVVLLQTNIVL